MTTLKRRLQRREFILAPGIYDGLSARIAERSGASALYVSGASLAYTRIGRPDIGLVMASELVDAVDAISEAVDVPLIVDADTGFGNALNVRRTVRMLERAGASAIQLEDQTTPKRCGHLAGKSLVTMGEMVGKIRAATDARESDDTVIIARTDAIAVEGIDRALERAHAYREAGADMLFVEAPRSDDEMTRIVAELGQHVPLLANMVEGGVTPVQSAGDLKERGFALAIFPGGLARAVAVTMQRYFDNLLQTGSNHGFRENMLDLTGINEIVDLKSLLALGATYDGGQL